MLPVSTQQLGQRERVLVTVSAQRARLVRAEYRGDDRSVRRVRVPRRARGVEGALARHARASVVDAFERPARDGAWGHTGGVYVWKTLKRVDDARASAFHARAVAKVREG